MDNKFPWRGVCCKQQQTGRADGFFFSFSAPGYLCVHNYSQQSERQKSAEHKEVPV